MKNKQEALQKLKPLPKQLTLWATFNFNGAVTYFVHLHSFYILSIIKIYHFFVLFTLRSLQCSKNHVAITNKGSLILSTCVNLFYLEDETRG